MVQYRDQFLYLISLEFVGVCILKKVVRFFTTLCMATLKVKGKVPLIVICQRIETFGFPSPQGTNSSTDAMIRTINTQRSNPAH